MGVNPDLDLSPGYIEFQNEDIKKYRWFLLFVVNLPLYTHTIWNPKTTYYRASFPQKERERIVEKETEDEENKIFPTRYQTTMPK
jgi:hypothetical protein